jgi:hypothetical protein
MMRERRKKKHKDLEKTIKIVEIPKITIKMV